MTQGEGPAPSLVRKCSCLLWNKPLEVIARAPSIQAMSPPPLLVDFAPRFAPRGFLFAARLMLRLHVEHKQGRQIDEVQFAVRRKRKAMPLRTTESRPVAANLVLRARRTGSVRSNSKGSSRNSATIGFVSRSRCWSAAPRARACVRSRTRFPICVHCCAMTATRTPQHHSSPRQPRRLPLHRLPLCRRPQQPTNPIGLPGESRR